MPPDDRVITRFDCNFRIYQMQKRWLVRNIAIIGKTICQSLFHEMHNPYTHFELIH